MLSNDLHLAELPLTLLLDEPAAETGSVVQTALAQTQRTSDDGSSPTVGPLLQGDQYADDPQATPPFARAAPRVEILPQPEVSINPQQGTVPFTEARTGTVAATSPTDTRFDRFVFSAPVGLAALDAAGTSMAREDPAFVTGNAVGSPTITSTAATFALHGGFYSAFADLAQAAYVLDEAELTGLGKNFIKPYANEAMERVGSHWNVLSPAELGFTVDASHDAQGTNTAALNSVWRMGASGIYYCDNAAAYAAVCNDALVISFRGTNDNDTGHPTPDEANWLDMTGHYDELRAFIDKVDSYVVANASITKVYATGHSLGGAMALGYMTEHPAVVGARVTYEAVTFAAPGYIGDADTLLGLSALESGLSSTGFVTATILNLLAAQLASAISLDDRIIGIEINGDVVPDLKYAHGRTVSVNPIGLTHTISSVPGKFSAGDSYGWTEVHTMNLYAAAAKSLDAGLRDTAVSTTSTVHGFDRSLFSPNDNALLGLSLSVAITEQFPDPAAVDVQAPGQGCPRGAV